MPRFRSAREASPCGPIVQGLWRSWVGWRRTVRPRTTPRRRWSPGFANVTAGHARDAGARRGFVFEFFAVIAEALLSPSVPDSSDSDQQWQQPEIENHRVS